MHLQKNDNFMLKWDCFLGGNAPSRLTDKTVFKVFKHCLLNTCIKNKMK